MAIAPKKGAPPWLSASLALALLALPQGGLADLPVHCLRHQVVGDWEFTLAPPKPQRSSCGHLQPDKPEEEPPLNYLQKNGPTTTLKLSLQDPSTVIAEDGSSGTWTMIYDEAFEVALGGTVFLAFSNFEYVQDAEGARTNVSHCDATQIGWYHDVERTRWGCYVGRKKGTPLPAKTKAAPVRAKPAAVQVTKPAAKADTPAPQDALTDDAADDDGTQQVTLAALNENEQQQQQQQQSDGSDEDAAGAEEDEQDEQAETGAPSWVPASAGYDKPMPHHWQKTVARALNFLQLGWTATAYDIFRDKTPRELNRFAGVKHSRPVPSGGFRSSQARAASVHIASSSFLEVRRSSGHESFDWRRKDGKDWLTAVVAQGDCGSCYTISTVHMLTARHRIAKSNVSEAPFSVVFPLYCSEYNQGCDGGYGFLQSKWSEDVGLVPEHCAPFSDASAACNSLNFKACDMGSMRYRAANHRYVGGFYGASEENSIRAELVKNGPVVMSFEPKEDFMYYKNGVYRSGPNKIHQEWEQVDHAVLLIGYGAEQEQAYWTLQNSWGSDWGEDGYFRMARGIDESGCESIVVAAEVIEEEQNAVLDGFIQSM